MSSIWKVVGHRGFPASYPENTLVGLLAACGAGVDAVELDVQLSGDGVPIVIHDDTLARTTSGEGLLKDFSFAELSGISAHFPDKFADKFSPLPLMSLEHVAIELAQHAKFVFIEIKEQSIPLLGHEKYLQKVLEASASLGDKRAIISFDFDILMLAKQQCNLALGLCLLNYDETSLAQARQLNPDLLICEHSLVPEGTVFWQGPWQWFVYGVETREEAESLFRRGVLWIEADDPLAVMSKGLQHEE